MRNIDLVLEQRKLPLPVLGLGTWRFDEERDQRSTEIGSVRSALETGYCLIDTAEMYGDGGAEEIVGAALADAGDVRPEEAIVVSKVLPRNASHMGTKAACGRGRRRLGLDTIDIYLLHWRGKHPLAFTIEPSTGWQQLEASDCGMSAISTSTTSKRSPPSVRTAR